MKLYFRKSLIRNIIQYPICVFLIAILFNSCKKEEVKYLSLNPSLLNITYENGQSKVNLTSNTEWNAVCANEWVILSPTSGFGDAEIQIQYESNDNKIPREAEVVFTGIGINNDTVKIKQTSSPIPEIPANLSATYNTTSNTVIITWEAVVGATSYRIYFSTTKDETYDLLGEVSSTSISDNNRYRFYKIKAINNGFESPLSEPVIEDIIAPNGLSAVFNKTIGAVIISWNPVNDATSYRVYFSTVKDGAYNLLGEISNTSISDNNRYGYYKISSVINEIEGNLSNYITESPAAPINLSASFSPTDNVVKVSWNIVPTAESYKVYYSINPNDGEYSFLGEVQGTFYSDPSRNRYYKVSAVNVGGESRLRYAISENGRDNQREPLIDIDGNSYKTVQIGNQVWMAENLRVTHTREGNTLPMIAANSTWEALSANSKAYCYYDNNKEVSISKEYGVLYTWEAAKEACPEGWHLPSSDEWWELIYYLRDNIPDGSVSSVLKSISGWTNYNDGTDDYGFSAYPAGERAPIDGNFVTGFYGAGFNVYWWGSNEPSIDSNRAYCQGSYYQNGSIDNSYYTPKNGGHSVRYVKNK